MVVPIVGLYQQLREMKHTYKITGMTCGNCEAKVKSSLLIVPNITNVEVSAENQTATIIMDKHIPLGALQTALDKKYTITVDEHSEITEQAKSWLGTYKPILLIFGYITAVSMIAGVSHLEFDWMRAMNIFMAGFFLTFSFFKLLDLKGFAGSYAIYDVVAMRFKSWGYVYAFAELALGIAYATGFQPLIINILTFTVMTVSILGVVSSLLNKRKIRCACLGAVFNLPMSTVTLVEDALMIGMSGVMLLMML